MKKVWYFISALLFLVLLLFSAEAKAGASAGLRLWGEILVPSLLPAFAAVGLLRSVGAADAFSRRIEPLLRRVPGLSGAGFPVWLAGLSGGYPLGARALADAAADGVLSREEAEELYACCDNTGPAFAVGALGTGVFGSAGWGLILWGIHALSALLLAAAVGKPRSSPSVSRSAPAKAFGSALTESVGNAVTSLLTIGGFVVLFSALPIEGLIRSLRLPEMLTVFLRGILELSSGIGSMKGMALSPGSLALGEFLLSFGGLCVHLQSLAMTEGAGLSGKKRLKGKLLQGVLSAAIAYGIGWIFL